MVNEPRNNRGLILMMKIIEPFRRIWIHIKDMKNPQKLLHTQLKWLILSLSLTQLMQMRWFSLEFSHVYSGVHVDHVMVDSKNEIAMTVALVIIAKSIKLEMIVCLNLIPPEELSE